MSKIDDYLNFKIKKNIGISGITDEFFCVLLNNLFLKDENDIIIVVNSLFEANKLYVSLKNFISDTLLFPMDDFLTSEALAISPDLVMNRLETINKLGSNKKSVVITNLMGYLRFLPTANNYKKFIFKYRVGDVVNPTDLADNLVSSGYKRDTIVTKTGEFALRGYVVDIFPIDYDYPVRIEFFDDEIESLRFFDCDTQKSLENCDELCIKPCTEFLISQNVDSSIFGKQKYLPNFDKVCSIVDYLNNPITFFKDYDQLKVSFSNIMEEALEYNRTRDMDFKGKYMFDLNEIKCDFPLYYMSINNIKSNYIDDIINFDIKTINNFSENIDSINSYIDKVISDGKTVLICLKEHQLLNISKHIRKKCVFSSMDNFTIGAVNLINFELNEGFIFNDLVFITAKELFINNNKKTKYKNNFKYSTVIKDANKLSVGDYVVHNVHGIGIYNGIKTLTLNNITKDYLEVLYQGTDKIFIPVEKIDLLYKYSGKEGMAPKINKLGGNEWKKTKNRVKSKVNDMANKLLALYAEREARKGFAFSPDCDMLIDFENDFPYELTSGQAEAIKQIKKDMELESPMDRLLCGDVGFGKTEVAFVAAFKAVLDSKQVLFLCPTTILSNQHYENALVRFKNYPVSIGLLNRFTSKKDVNRILEGLSNGTIDIVFGTHRLLSNDVKVKNLGLLIIDEEQRFGVAHKEKIKEYKSNVDVLTLTATPIPRTLQMSLVGIRSLSLLETPPMNRYPVQTYVIEENNQIIKDAIYKELSRNGQTFILYNKVQSIEEEKFKIENLVPEARVVVAHGQMSKNELENVIFDFTKHKYDVLVCTTIIETGIDIPNVNTLIIKDADRFGLSQLYQIRGRVGRGDKFAYAYLMYKPFKTLSETSIKRLNVIKEFTELGSGFSIATRDLSIRGAGDILGSEQAGFIDSVGIDLYLKMLNNEVSRRQNITVDDEEQESQPLINVTTHISDSYVSEDELKIEIHRKINEINSKEKLDAVKNELEDRFGKLNEDVIIYMYEEWFEKLASKLKIVGVKETKNYIDLVFPMDIIEKLDMEEIFMIAYHISNMFRFVSRGSNLSIILDTIKLDKHPLFYLVDLLNEIYIKYENVLTN